MQLLSEDGLPTGVRRRLLSVVVGLIAMSAAICLGQDSTPPPGSPGQNYTPSLGPIGGPETVVSPNQQSGLGEASGDSGVWPWPSAAGNASRGGGAWLPDEMVGFGGMGGLGGFGGGLYPSDSFRYSALWFPTVPVQGQSTNLEMVDENLSFTHPLWKDSISAWSLTAGVRNDLFQTAAILPETGQPLPSELWAVNLGLRYNRLLDDGWIVGGGVSFGSASDHPFATIHELDVGMNAMLRIPQGEHNAWVFTLMYSPMNELNFPLPGVAFFWNPSPQFCANIGLPLMLMWRPTDDWQFQATYMLIRTVHLKALFRITEGLKAFAAYDWSNEAYSLLDRPDLNDRFFIYDQRVSIGLQASLWKYWTGSISAGYVFDRYMFEGESFTGTGANRVDLGSGPFAALNLGVRF